MNNTSKKLNLILFTIICIVLVATIAFGLCTTYENKSQQSASAAVIMSSFESVDGYMYGLNNRIISTATSGYEMVNGRYHMTQSGAASTYGVGSLTTAPTSGSLSTSAVYKISSAAQLRYFLENATSASHRAVLISDIDYNMPNISVTGSGTRFYGELDGNAYTVTITPPEAGTDITSCAVLGSSDSDSAGQLFGEAVRFSYYGIFVGINSGSIKNLNIEFEENEESAMNAGAASTSSGATLISTNAWATPIVGGIVCGLNYGGTITNCHLSINGAFAIGKANNSKNSQVVKNNYSVAGGVCGAIVSGKIERTTVVNNGGILAVSDGDKSLTGTKTAGASAGGIVGIIRSGTGSSAAKIVNCSIAGSGPVVGMCGHDVRRRNNDGAYGFAGGVCAGDIYPTSANDPQSRELEEGQINGIISAWTGFRKDIWNTSNSDTRKIKSIYGCLFDYLGEEEAASEAIDNIAILYDYLAWAQSHSSEYTTLDSHMAIKFGNWVEIFAQNAGGDIKVCYDYANSTSPIRVEAVSEGFNASDIDSHTESSGYQYALGSGTKGKFIWDLTTVYTEIEKYTEDDVEKERIIYTPKSSITVLDSCAANVQYVSADADKAVQFIYTFGEKCALSFINNNTKEVTSNYVNDLSKNYDGESMRLPSIKVTNKAGDNLTINSEAYALFTEYTVLGTTDETYPANSEYFYLPGLYEVDSKKTVVFDDISTNYKYYDKDSHILVDYNENDELYSYYINNNKSSLLNISCNSDSVTWVSSDIITFNYDNRAGVIDYYAYAKGNAAAGTLIDMPSKADATIPVAESGKFYYTIYTYVENPYYEGSTLENPTQYLSIASKSIQVFVDTQAPVIKNVKYYIYDESKPNQRGTQILESEILDPNEWQWDDVLVEYEVRDSNLSGLSAGSGHTDFTEVNESRWDCRLRLTGANSSQMVVDPIDGITYATQTVTYQDSAGNSVSQTFRAKIDTTKLRISNVKALNSSEYLNYVASDLGYCPTTVKISFTPTFGASGAYMYYSYQQDANGADIWVKSNLNLKSNQPNTFVVDFELYNKPLKMKLVSARNMYSDALANDDGYVRNGAENDEEAKIWKIKIIIAGIGITLDNLFYNDIALSSMKEAELNALFNKTYNASNESSVELTAKVYSSGTNPLGEALIIYSDQYLYTEPAIEESYLKVVATFANQNHGTWGVTLRVDSIGDYYNKYLVRFLTKDSNDNWIKTTNLNELTTDKTKYLTGKIVANSTIEQVALNVKVFNYLVREISEYYEGANYYIYSGDQYILLEGIDSKDAFVAYQKAHVGTIIYTNSYIYGSEIPTQITVAGVGESILLNLITNAKKTQDDDGKDIYPIVGVYDNIDASFAVANDNYTLNIEKASINIIKRKVIVTTTLDGMEYYNTTITFDGLKHVIAGSFKDIYNEINAEKVKITYYKDNVITDDVIEVGTYYAHIAIDDENYTVGNTGNPIKFVITKGYLNINLSEQTKSFAGSKLKFDITTLNSVNEDYYKDGELTIKYYRVVNDTAIFTEVDPFEVGKYLVQISFANCEYFYDMNYDDTYLTIEKAKTTIKADDVSVVYDGEEHTFDILETGLVVSANGGNTVVVKVENGALKYTTYNGSTPATPDASTVIELRYIDPTTATPLLINGTNMPKFTDSGDYSFRITFKGDDCFDSVSVRVTYKVLKATFTDVEFNDAKYYFVDQSATNYHSIFVTGDGLQKYIDMGAVLTYTYFGNDYIDRGVNGANILNSAQWEYTSGVELEENPLSFNNVGTYQIIAVMTMDNYEDFNATATLEIDKTAMPNVIPKSVTDYYNGTFHPGEFEIETDLPVVPTYYVGYESCKYIEYLTMGTEIIYVEYGEGAAPINVGTYYGVITLRSESYADTEITVQIVINPTEIKKINFDSLKDIIGEIDSSTDLSELYPTFVFGGQTYSANYEYYNEAGEKVELNDDGTLDPGNYVVKVTFSNGNYYTEQEAELEIAQASSNSGNKSGNKSGNSAGSIVDLIKQNMLYVIIGGAVLGVAIIGIVLGVALSKKKKGKSRRRPNRPNKGGRGSQRPSSGGGKTPPPASAKTSQAPVKKERREGPQDKAQF